MPALLHIPTETPAERVRRVMAGTFIEPQAKWVADRSRIKVAYKCRQLGFTWCQADVSVDEASKQGALYDTWVTSRDTAQAQLFIEDCKYWARLRKIAADDRGEVIFDADRDLRAFKIEFATGRSIYSLSSNPDAQAGKRGHRVADEFALHKDQRRLYSIMQPGLQWGGSMAFISTPRGTQSFMHTELVKPALDPSTNRKKISLHIVTLEQAVRAGLWIKISSRLPAEDERKRFTDDDFLQSVRDECPDEETWLQEYCCIPADDAAAFLSWEQINACGETWAELKARPLPADAPRYVGYDIARKRDLSVITVLCDVGGTLVVEKVVTMEKTPFSEQRRRLFTILDQANVKRCAIDAGGLGMDTAEQAAARYGQDRVIQMVFTLQSKLAMAGPLKQRFEDRTLRIPCGAGQEERLYTADLRSIKKEVTAAGNIIITSEAGATDGHADRFWSLALAAHAASGPVQSTAAVVLKGRARLRGVTDPLFGRSSNRGGAFN